MVRYLTASCIIGYFLCLPACSIGASLRRIGGCSPDSYVTSCLASERVE